MTGIFLITVVIAWLCAAAWLASWGARRIERNELRILTGGLLFVVLMALPVADEIIGGVQFRHLCEQSRQIHINKDKAFGKTITMRNPRSGYVRSIDRRIPNVTLPITESEFIWRDVETNEEILSYKSLNVRAGWFIRLLGISEGDSPLLIGSTSCMPDVSKVFSEFNLKQAK